MVNRVICKGSIGLPGILNMNILTQLMNNAGNKLTYFAGGNLEINVLRYGNWMIEGRSGLSSRA